MVSLSAASAQTVTVGYATADGTATAPADYSPASGTLTFSPGQTSKTIQVRVYGDRTAEADETFFVNLSNASGATIGDGQGVGTILNDDGSPGGRSASAGQPKGWSGRGEDVALALAPSFTFDDVLFGEMGESRIRRP